MLCGDGEIGAVNVVDENGDVKEDYGKEQRPEALRRSFSIRACERSARVCGKPTWKATRIKSGG